MSVYFWFRDLNQAKQYYEAASVKPQYVIDAEEHQAKAPYSPARKKLLRSAESRWSDARFQITISIQKQWPSKKYCRESLDIRRYIYGDIRDNRAKSLEIRTPGWFGELDEFVLQELKSLKVERRKATGIVWHIDHMIPLESRTASGLHCATNLQLAPGFLNIKKGRQLKMTQPDEWLKALRDLQLRAEKKAA